MNADFVPYLCGGILFSFLMELHKDTTETLHNNSLSTKKVIKQHEIMEKLILTINPDYKYNNRDTLKSKTSEYRTCKFNGGNIIPFNLDSTKEIFDKSVHAQYDEVLDNMTKFTTECFPTCTRSAMRILVKRTLMLIRDDSSIKNDTLFFINEDGSPISKEALLKKEEFCFQSFLVGTWHYIITKPTKNSDGQQTFKKLFFKGDGQPYQLDTSCFKPYQNNINITERKISKDSSSQENYECQDITEPSKVANSKGKSEIKIYYKGGLLEDREEKAILSFSPEIIDLDKNPDISFEGNPVSSIYKITTEFQFETHFLSSTEEIIRLSCGIGPASISGTTSLERWLSRSKLNTMRFRKKGSCTAWFRMKKFNENEYDADFYIIGELLQ